MLQGNIDTLYTGWEETRTTWYGEKDDLNFLSGTSWIIKNELRGGNLVTSL